MADENAILFTCSFCEQQIKITKTHVGRRIKCPKCIRTVFLFPNRNQNIDSLLTSSWYYNRPRLLFGSDQIGPISDEQFVQLVRAGEIDDDFEVSSPQLTGSQTVNAGRINFSIIQEQIEQRHAELQRRQRKEARKQAIAIDSRERLARAIVSAVSDGQVTLREREQLLQFAQAARIPEEEVETLLRAEAKRLCDALIEECICDGILDPAEKQRISELAVGLGLTLTFTPEQSRRLEMCELAWQLVSNTFHPEVHTTADISLSAKETPLASARTEWHEVVKQNKPVGISIGDGHYLKAVGKGDCILTNKRIVLVDTFHAKKITLSSIEIVSRYDDGVFCQRSTGKSVFLKLNRNQSLSDRFSMLVEHTVMQNPVLGIIPAESFISTDIASYQNDDVPEFVESQALGSSLPPRYTFRVVGDHVDNRSDLIERINLGDSVNLVPSG